MLRRADRSKILAVRVDDLNAGARGHVQPALGVHRHAISPATECSIGTRLRIVKLHERTPVLGGAVRLNVERPEIFTVGIGDEQDFSVEGQADAVWPRNLIVDEDQIPRGRQVINESRRHLGWRGLACKSERGGIGEVDSALLVHDDVVRQTQGSSSDAHGCKRSQLAVGIDRHQRCLPVSAPGRPF